MVGHLGWRGRVSERTMTFMLISNGNLVIRELVLHESEKPLQPMFSQRTTPGHGRDGHR